MDIFEKNYESAAKNMITAVENASNLKLTDEQRLKMEIDEMARHDH